VTALEIAYQSQDDKELMGFLASVKHMGEAIIMAERAMRETLEAFGNHSGLAPLDTWLEKYTANAYKQYEGMPDAKN
jgi:hypothetical protein